MATSRRPNTSARSRRKPPMEFLDLVIHPEDVGQLKEGIRTAMPAASDFRWKRACVDRTANTDGLYTRFGHCGMRPSRITRWCGTRIDIDDRKRKGERAEKENLVLREEIDKVFDVRRDRRRVARPASCFGSRLKSGQKRHHRTDHWGNRDGEGVDCPCDS